MSLKVKLVWLVGTFVLYMITVSGGTIRADSPRSAEATRAPDRTIAFLPQSTGSPVPIQELGSQVVASAARGQAPHSAWAKYIAIWRAHHESPDDSAIRQQLQIPLGKSAIETSRPGRTSPPFLGWRPGSFRVVQTPHFQIRIRFPAANDRDDFDTAVTELAGELENIFCVWTQVFFPLWWESSTIQQACSGWDPERSTASEFCHAPTRRTRAGSLRRHQVVVFATDAEYQEAIQSRRLAGGAVMAVASSTGFYSSRLRNSFFVLNEDTATRAHEICHQLFSEATHSSVGASLRQASLLTNHPDFWLVEGIAGYFESLRFDGAFATVGGWESPRLQYARYRHIVAQQPIESMAALRGSQSAVLARVRSSSGADLAGWYAQAITRAHAMMDANGGRFRSTLLRQLARVYGVAIRPDVWTDATEDQELTPSSIAAFLKVNDADLALAGQNDRMTSICLSGCPITGAGLASLSPQRSLNWLDLSRTTVTDLDVTGLLPDASSLSRLSLEATSISPALAGWLRRARDLTEIDLSWTSADDLLVGSLAGCRQLETVWLTGSRQVTDRSVDVLLSLPSIKMIDVQRTGITEAGLQRLQTSRQRLQINPLSLDR